MEYEKIKENLKKEQFAVYEKEPAHGKDKDGVILASFNSKEEAEAAGKKYGYHGENYYVSEYMSN
jgi:hypothetical protein|tara:strand:- start:2409 stop:2603 length:195 start_codon:yes stop_codon:yes gene_type:complete